MSAGAWTPEPWRRANHGTEEIESKGAALLADFGNIGTARADRDRAIACVNACVGVEDPAAEIARLREIEAAARALVRARLEEPEVLACSWPEENLRFALGPRT